VIRSGKTILTTAKLLKKANAEIVGALTIAAVGKEWQKINNSTTTIVPIFQL
jgi:adenine/guanine phosphoribosyltransferase-like PRPP-binding protein